MATRDELDALELLSREVQLSRRSVGLALPPSFVRNAVGTPAMARLAGAGRGGDVRTKMFLTFALRAARGVPQLQARSAPVVAKMFALPTGGPRRVSDALRWLERNKFVSLERRTGEWPIVTLLDGEDSPAELARRGLDGRYVSVPLELWSRGEILRMPAREIAVYVAIADLTEKIGRDEPMSGFRKRQYGISDDTWTRAMKGLRDRGLVSSRWSLDDDPQRQVRMRTFYRREPADSWAAL